MQLIFGIFVVIRLKQIKLNKNLRLDSVLLRKYWMVYTYMRLHICNIAVFCVINSTILILCFLPPCYITPQKVVPIFKKKVKIH